MKFSPHTLGRRLRWANVAVNVLVPAVFLMAPPIFAVEATATAANAINALGIDLLQRLGKPDVNALCSPYSIQNALAMAYAGAEGDTRKEMAKVLHYPEDDAELQGSFAALRKALDEMLRKSEREAEQMKKRGATNDPVTISVANRLFGQTGYDFREPFVSVLKNNYDALLEPLDFVRNAPGATKHINAWVEDQTRQRIRNLIPDGALNQLTRLVLVNAIYLKAPWANKFEKSETKPRAFHMANGTSVDVPTMTAKLYLGYSKRTGFSILTIPYQGADIQILILLPDVEGVAGLEKKLTASLLNECATASSQEAILYLPKFMLAPPLMLLSTELEGLGMRSAFDQPHGSANFERIAKHRPDDYLSISEVFHKTFISLDENGTEAAAATAVTMATLGIIREKPKLIEVRVDHPFVFAIQHRPSGACLFLGRVADPR